MRPEHRYYKEVNAKDGDYYRRWASVYGPNMSECIDTVDLLIIDDFGLMELDMDKCRDRFEVIETRDCRKATMIVSKLPVIKWWDLFKDNTYANACLSRMIAKAYRLECNGRDMRKTFQ